MMSRELSTKHNKVGKEGNKLDIALFPSVTVTIGYGNETGMLPFMDSIRN